MQPLRKTTCYHPKWPLPSVAVPCLREAVVGPAKAKKYHPAKVLAKKIRLYGMFTNHFPGWWYTYPSETYFCSSVGMIFHSQYDGKVIIHSCSSHHQSELLHLVDYGSSHWVPQLVSLDLAHLVPRVPICGWWKIVNQTKKHWTYQVLTHSHSAFP